MALSVQTVEFISYFHEAAYVLYIVLFILIEHSETKLCLFLKIPFVEEIETIVSGIQIPLVKRIFRVLRQLHTYYMTVGGIHMSLGYSIFGDSHLHVHVCTCTYVRDLFLMFVFTSVSH